jgi:hypothetical protein
MKYEELPDTLKSVFEQAVEMTPGVDEEDIEAVRDTYVRVCEKTLKLYEEKEEVKDPANWWKLVQRV